MFRRVCFSVLAVVRCFLLFVVCWLSVLCVACCLFFPVVVVVPWLLSFVG